MSYADLEGRVCEFRQERESAQHGAIRAIMCA